MSDIVRNPRGGGHRRVLIYGGAAVVVFGAVFWTRHRASVSAAADTTDSTDTGYDPTTDPGYDTSGYGDYSPTTDYPPYGVTPGIEPSMPTPPRTNAEWTQQAVTYMTAQGFNPATVAVALGVYLRGGGLTQHQYNLVTAALAGVGNPPTAPAPPHVTQGPGQPALKPAPHLVITKLTKTDATLHWSSVKGASHYRVQRADGTVLKDQVGTTATIVRQQKHDETIHVTAYRLTHAYSKASNTVQVHQR